MPQPIYQALMLLISVIFYSYVVILIVRIMMQQSGVNFYNPFAQGIYKITNPPIYPLQKILPRVRRFDLPCVIVLWVTDCIKVWLTVSLTLMKLANPIGVLLMSIPDIIGITLDIIFFAILIVVILSWIQPQRGHPILDILNRITNPYLRWARSILPPLGGFDLSPIIIMVVLKLIDILLVHPLFIYFGRFA